MIKVEHLSKYYGSKQVLKDINLSFYPGKVYGVMGENGAGKTTLFRCMVGLESYKGQVISDKHPLKNHTGLLLTEPFFFNKMTGKEYIRLLLNARGISLSNINDKNIFDLPLKAYVSTYSTGMKKKLALMAILLQKNDYYILDEPFNGVDIQSNILITDIIQSLKALGKTLIISSHIFSTLADTCDEIHLLKEGILVKTVPQKDFSLLEAEMKDTNIGHKIEMLGL